MLPPSCSRFFTGSVLAGAVVGAVVGAAPLLHCGEGAWHWPGRSPKDALAWLSGLPPREDGSGPRLRVVLKPGTDAAAFASAHGLAWHTMPGKSGGVWRLEGRGRSRHAEPSAEWEAAVRAVREDARVLAVEPVRQAVRQTLAAPNDPFFASSWHLHNTGENSRTGVDGAFVPGGLAGMDANVLPAWGEFGGAGWRGAGVRISIIDDGLENAHPDLQGDTETDRDWTPLVLGNTTPGDASPELTTDNHGTAVAGIAAARGNNGIGVSGAAPEAQLVGLRLLGGALDGRGVTLNDEDEAEAFFYLAHSGAATIDIKNNSWGPLDQNYLLDGPGPFASEALRWATTHGRGGLGTIFVFAAGNGRFVGEDANMNGYANAPQGIAVAALTDDGSVAPYSEPGACLLISAPGGPDTEEILVFGARKNGIFTTDRSGVDGYNTNAASENNGYTRTSNGTSAAAPIVSGVCALMLQANPGLGWRDVQEILIRSARKNRPEDPGWFTNAAGFHFHDDFGAGLIDASAAVALARTWENLGHLKVVEQTHPDTPLPIMDPGPVVGPLVIFTVAGSGMRVERAGLTLDIAHAQRGQLELELLSPSGTRILLKRAIPADRNADFANWEFTTPHLWGEPADGVWAVVLKDTIPGVAGTLNRADLRLWGTSPKRDAYETWLAGVFGEAAVNDPAQKGLWGADADPDRDGWSNLAEAYFGTPPLANGQPESMSVAIASGVATLRWQESGLEGVEATAQWSPDLLHWYLSDESPDGVMRGFSQQSANGQGSATLALAGLDRVWLRLSIARTPSVIDAP